MMTENSRERAIAFLQSLVGQSLSYAIKSPDMDLYNFGFGDSLQYILHVVCRLKVIWKDGSSRRDCYDEDTPSDIFSRAIEQILGAPVKRIELSDKNDLWLDCGEFWIVFATFENGEESWRVFAANGVGKHLVAADIRATARKAQGCAMRQPELVGFLLTFTIHQAKTHGICRGFLLVHRKRFELLAFGSVDQRSIQLS